MLRIDSHQHFWKYNSQDFDWITDDMSIIRKDFRKITGSVGGVAPVSFAWSA